MAHPELSIRRATAADAELLSRLATELFRLGCPADTRPEDIEDYVSRELTPERFAALLADERATLLIACDRDEAVGYTYLLRGDAANEAGAATHELGKFYVAPSHHGRGVANSLMEALLHAAGPDNAIWLSVFSGNPRAIAFYRRWGFRITGAKTFLVGKDLQEDYRMERAANAREADARAATQKEQN